MKQRYEHKCITRVGYYTIMGACSELEKDGWELVSYVPAPSGSDFTAIFKRPSVRPRARNRIRPI